ncbi:MAG: MotA/TolQ/ExbB proton channel family protein [Verrucomicrobiota bacterium]|jgi:biopolymer transport protein ExbB
METFIIICLLLTSVTAITFIVERGLALRVDKVTPQPVMDAVLNYSSARDLPLLRAVCTQNPSPISRLLLFATEHLDVPKSENSALLETRARHELSALERGLVVLEIIVGIAPLLGLVGTIFGLILLFGSMGAGPGAGDSARFAAGISTALNATLLGLLIAIPALIAWSYYSRKVETFAVRMESLCDEFLRKQYRSQTAAGTPQDRPL